MIGRDGFLMGIVKKEYNSISMIIIMLVIAVSVFFGSKKQGYYIDEYYVYCVANGTQAGMDINLGEWNNTDRYFRHLVSEGEENFHFQQTYENEINGTHPPLYYYLVHFVSSVFSGVFSKWIGLSVNIILLLPIMILVKRIAWKLSGNNEIITLLTMLFYGLSPATISMTMLIRMYLMLSLWVLLYAYVHIMDIERDHLSIPGFLLPVFICGFFGFLTQYFFVILMFFITCSYAFYLLVLCHRLRDACIYVLTAVSSLLCTYFPWPFSFFHIVQGSRGKGAFSQIRDSSSYLNRFFEHLVYMNKMMFSGLFPIFVLMLIIGIFILVNRCKAIYRSAGTPILKNLSVSARGFILLGIASILNFIVLTQLSLMDGIECFRHTYASYAIFMILLPIGVYKILDNIFIRANQLPYIVTLVIVLLILVLGFCQKRVLFLFENEKEAMLFAKEHPNEKVVMFENDDGNYDSVMQQMIMYPRVYFALASDLETVKDSEVANADELLVYITTGTEDVEACLDSIYEQNSKITKAEHMWDFSFFSVYLMN